MTVGVTGWAILSGMTKRCEACGGDMSHKRANARTCSAACRKALSRGTHAPPAPEEPAPSTPTAGPAPAAQAPEATAPAALDTPTELRGRLESSVRAKFSTLSVDYEHDPLAVHILGMAYALDTPGSMAPGSLTGMGKAFRDAYKEYLREHETPDESADPLAAAQASAAAKLQLLQASA